jgi:fatty-acyl-CoA synthase
MPSRTAIRFLSGTTPADPVRDVRFDELLQRVIQTANLLAPRASARRHRDHPAAQRAGDLLRAVGRGDRRVANPVNYFLNASQIAGIMKEAGAKALIAADPSLFADIWPKVEAIRDTLPGSRCSGSAAKGPAPAGVIDFEAAIAAQPGDKLLAPKTLARDTWPALFHTGGTTGLPKARAPHPWRD